MCVLHHKTIESRWFTQPGQLAKIFESLNVEVHVNNEGYVCISELNKVMEKFPRQQSAKPDHIGPPDPWVNFPI